MCSQGGSPSITDTRAAFPTRTYSMGSRHRVLAPLRLSATAAAEV